MEKEFITIKIERSRYRKIYTDDILYCKADRIYSIIKTIEREFMYSKPLKELELLLNEKQFLRVNRSYVVNIAKCVEFKTGNGAELILCNNEIIKPTEDVILKLKENFKIIGSEVEKGVFGS